MELLPQAGIWLGFALWALLLLAVATLVYVGLGGTFFVAGLALVHALVTGFDPIGWRLLLLLLGLALLGEGIEALLGTLYVARRGATRHGVIGAYAGGLLGAVAGSPLLPIIGTIAGGFAGAFAGAVAGEYLRQRSLEPSLRIGWHSLLGRLAAILVKHALGLAMVALVLRTTWPAGR